MKKRSVALWGEYGLSAFKYLIAVFMMFAGVATAFAPIEPAGADFGWLYESRYALVLYGVTFFLSGLALFWGKIRKSRKWTGIGLLWIYLSFLYAALLNMLVWGIADPSAWGGNLIVALVVGGLYLRWRFQTAYINPKHFTRDIHYHDPKDDDERY